VIELREETGHPSRWALSRLASGDLGADEARELRAHADGCVECGAVVAAVAAEREAFALSPVRRDVLQALQAEADRRESWWARLGRGRWLAPAGALAAAAVALLLVVQPDVRTKGAGGGGWFGWFGDDAGFELGYKMLVDGQVLDGESGQPLAPGARIQFLYSAPSGGFLYVIGVDSLGQVNQYYPGPGAESAEVGAALGQPLSHSVILDEAPAERVFALLCDRPLAPDELAAGLRGAAALLEAERLPFECEQQILDLPRRQR